MFGVLLVPFVICVKSNYHSATSWYHVAMLPFYAAMFDLKQPDLTVRTDSSIDMLLLWGQ